jgi:curved DNA-binding protein CbpA
MDQWKDFYYYVLEVSKASTLVEIKKNYRKLMKMCHPDRVGENKVLEARCKEITVAYSVLSDEKLRKEYDTRWNKSSTGTTRSRKRSYDFESSPNFDDWERRWRKRRKRNKPKTSTNRGTPRARPRPTGSRTSPTPDPSSSVPEEAEPPQYRTKGDGLVLITLGEKGFGPQGETIHVRAERHRYSGHTIPRGYTVHTKACGRIWEATVSECYDSVSKKYLPSYEVHDIGIDAEWKRKYPSKPVVSGGSYEGSTMTAPLEPIYAEYRELSGYETKKSGPEFFGFCNAGIVSLIGQLDPSSIERVNNNLTNKARRT